MGNYKGSRVEGSGNINKGGKKERKEEKKKRKKRRKEETHF
jgi:hypothetical protein